MGDGKIEGEERKKRESFNSAYGWADQFVYYYVFTEKDPYTANAIYPYIFSNTPECGVDGNKLIGIVIVIGVAIIQYNTIGTHCFFSTL